MAQNLHGIPDDATARKIRTITSVEELDGYTTEAKRRGITTDELVLLAEQRKRLGGGK